MPRMLVAVAAIVVLLNPARLIGWYFEISTDELADPLVDLLPQVDVMRIKRVVEVEHPGIDVGEGAGGFHHNLSAVMPANGSRKMRARWQAPAGHPIRRGHCDSCRRQRTGSPAFAGDDGKIWWR